MKKILLFFLLWGVFFWLFSYVGGLDIDPLGSRAARELATARVEIGLARAEHRIAMRKIYQVTKDHERLFKIVEEAYHGCNSVAREKRNEKAVPTMDKR